MTMWKPHAYTKKEPNKCQCSETKESTKWTNIYLKEQTEHIQHQINRIQHSVEDRQSRIMWQTVNEVSKEKAQREQN